MALIGHGAAEPLSRLKWCVRCRRVL